MTNPDDNERMPPSGERLTAEQIQTLKQWIKNNAPWPETDGEADRHWSFQPVRRSPVPSAVPVVAGSYAASTNPIDAFIRQKLEPAKLKPSPEADRRTLIR